jgi:hypothetical protein
MGSDAHVSQVIGAFSAGGSVLSDPPGIVEHDFDTRRAWSMGDLVKAPDNELIDELTMLTTQTARMRARMFDLMAELDRRRSNAA